MSELPDRPYLEMTSSEGRTALEVFVAERPAALARLLESTGDGLDLDGSRRCPWGRGRPRSRSGSQARPGRWSGRLGAEPGVLEAYREDREVLLVRAPGGDARRLRTWVVSDLGGR